MNRFSLWATAAALVLTATAGQTQTPKDPEPLIGEVPKAQVLIYPHYIDDYSLGERLPARLRKLEVAPDLVVDVARFRSTTRLDRAPEMLALRRNARSLGIKISYSDTVYDLTDRLLFDRELTIRYDPELCRSAPKTAAAKAAQGQLCFMSPTRKGGKDSARLADAMRARLKTAPADYKLPNGMNRDQGLKLADLDLLDVYMNSGTLTVSNFSELPTTAFFDPTSKIEDALHDTRAIDGPVRPKGTDRTVTDLSQAIVYRSPPGIAPEDRSTKRPDGKIPRIEGVQPSITDEGQEKLNRIKWQKMMDGGVDMLGRGGVNGKTLNPKLLQEVGVIEQVDPNLPPEVQNRLGEYLAEQMPDRVTATGRIENPDFFFLTGFTLGRSYVGHVGHTFYEGDRVFDPIYVRLSYWFSPIFTMKAPFKGTASKAEWTFRKHVAPHNQQVFYYPQSISVDVQLSGQDVAPDGREVFSEVGLPGDRYAFGYEFYAGFTAGSKLKYDLPGFDADETSLGTVGFGIGEHFAPALGRQRTEMVDISVGPNITNLGLDLWFASVGIDVGIVLFGTDGRVTAKAETTNPLFTSEWVEFRDGEKQIRLSQPFDVNMAPSSVPLTLSNPTYRFAMEIAPFLTPFIEVGFDDYNWRFDRRIVMESAAITAPITLLQHAGTDNTNNIRLVLPEVGGN